MSERIRIAIVDDHPIYREGLAGVLVPARGFAVVGHGSSAADALSIARKLKPDVMIVDVMMPGGGIAAAQQIATELPQVKVVMLTASESQDNVTAALEAGARGYIVKGIGGNELIDTLRAIQFGESYVSPVLAARMLMEMQRRPKHPVKPSDTTDLTHREEEILSLVADGLTNKEIAIRLDISEKTVKQHMTSIMQKLHCRNRVEAVNHLHQRRAAVA